AHRGDVPVRVIRVVRQIQAMRLTIPTKAAQARVALAALGERAGLIERHQLLEVLGARAAQAEPRAKALGHLRRQVALAVNHELQIVGRAEAGAFGECAKREATHLVLEVMGAQIGAVVLKREHIRAGRLHRSAAWSRSVAATSGKAPKSYLASIRLRSKSLPE